MNGLFIIGILLGTIMAMAIWGALVPQIIDANEISKQEKISYMVGLGVGIIVGSAICFIIYNHVKAQPNP